MKNTESWLLEEKIPSYLFFHAFYFAKFQKGDRWISDCLSQIIGDNDYDTPIIDAGCGTGATTFLLGKLNGKAVGIDSSETMLSVANSRKKAQGISNVSFEKEDMYLYRYRPNSCVFSSSLVHLLGQQAKINYLTILRDSLVKRVILFIPEIVSNPNTIATDVQQINGATCVFLQGSFTDYTIKTHHVSYKFHYQNRTYEYEYCFDYLTPKDVLELSLKSGWRLIETYSNPSQRIDLHKNMVVQERIYVLENATF